MGALAGIPVIGWAKPVPVNPNRLRDATARHGAGVPRRPGDESHAHGGGRVPRAFALQAAALRRDHLDSLSLPVLVALLFAEVNLFLGVLNLLPIPPLDGSALLERVLPASGSPVGTSSALR